MNEPVDPFELLRKLNPIEPGDMSDAATSAQARETLEQILGGTRHPRRRRRLTMHIPRPRRRTYLLALVPLTAALAAAAWALSQGATQHLTIGCYASADLQAHTVIVAATDNSPTETCASVWQRGDFGSPSLPRLQACVLSSGAVAVFPSPDARACKQLKLAPFTGASSTPQRRGSATTLKNALVEKFLSNACIGRDEATSTIRAELRRQHLNNWNMEVTGAFAATRPCASLGFDEEQHRVLLIPIPKRP